MLHTLERQLATLQMLELAYNYSAKPSLRRTPYNPQPPARTIPSPDCTLKNSQTLRPHHHAIPQSAPKLNS
ncbi:hypothetical protein PtA15_11A442 [Puccinia triticina]|uniref:Uncharacterized protein n=1 Tax=Puccinia triticina TaxID=208348 RepID=A0ABY7CWU6_9BASI|nr:uncharacterized protein PtA15_11A442 [Puccinia triticina]WAQ89751.1 hypothetical protein PtA15_11A442 [Puccinia triticina]